MFLLFFSVIQIWSIWTDAQTVIRVAIPYDLIKMQAFKN